MERPPRRLCRPLRPWRLLLLLLLLLLCCPPGAWPAPSGRLRPLPWPRILSDRPHSPAWLTGGLFHNALKSWLTAEPPLPIPANQSEDPCALPRRGPDLHRLMGGHSGRASRTELHCRKRRAAAHLLRAQLMGVGCVLGTCQVQHLRHRLWQLKGRPRGHDSSPMNPSSPHSYG